MGKEPPEDPMETFTRRIFEREAILLEAEGLFSEIDALERPDEVDDVRAILEGRIPELNERSLRVLDLMDEEAPNWGRFGALAPAIARSSCTGSSNAQGRSIISA